jgi:cytochrome c
VASHAGFNYSAALKGKGGNWTYEALNDFVHNPKQAVPGTIMAFAGIAQAKERADILAYLRTLADSPVPLPAAQ